jgi:DNA (cytosine-5)-methyltransferase 1
MSLTVTDLFCGGGGSSTGMASVPGVQIRMAANHWTLAVDVHNSNHPDTDHAAVDLHLEDPRFFPRTDILWASPECTKWSPANGSKPLPAIEEGLFEDPSDDAASRSRLLMFDVLRFAEHHRYRAMVIENVVDVATQPKYQLAWQVWRQELIKLGYRFRVVSLNSMHAQALGLPAPQSRDRIYVVCWLAGHPEPDIDRMIRPRAWCPRCDKVVESAQAWKPGRTVGRYRQQYEYHCTGCGRAVEPGWLPAAAAIDWSIPGKRIGDRDKPLADKTRARIAAGIARYWHPFHLEAAGHTYDAADPKHPSHGDPNGYYRAWSTYDVLKTLHTTESKALAIPVEGRDGKEARPMGMPMRTQTTRLETALLTPLHVSLMGGDPAHIAASARPVDHELRTLTAEGNNDYLLTPYYGATESGRPVTQPIGTLTTVDRYALITRHYGIKGGDAARHTTPTDEYLRTLTATGGNMSLVTPSGGTWNEDARPTDEALRALTTREAYALVHRHNTGGAEMLTPAIEVLRTLTTKGHQSLVTPGDLEAAHSQVDDCLFRMLEPHELAAGMAFPADYSNAVTPPAARDLIGAVADELVEACSLTPYARAEFDYCSRPEDTDDDVERARRYWVRITQSFSGALGREHDNSWSTSTRCGTGLAKQSQGLVRRMQACAYRLTNVIIDNRDAIDTIERYADADAVVYADPPYLAQTRRVSSRGTPKDYLHEFAQEEDHRALAAALHATSATVVLSGYPSPLYDELYAGWARLEWVKNADAANRAGKPGRQVTEVIWSNRPLDRQDRFTFDEATA